MDKENLEKDDLKRMYEIYKNFSASDFIDCISGSQSVEESDFFFSLANAKYHTAWREVVDE